MKISQLLLEIIDSTSGISIQKSYLLGTYTTVEKAEIAQTNFQTKIFIELIHINEEVISMESVIRIKAKRSNQDGNHNNWTDKDLIKEFNDNRQKREDFLNLHFEFAKGAFYPIVETECADEFELSFKIRTLAVQ